MRLRAHLDSRVQVPDLADTARPVTESNCAGAITPGGKQLKVNDQSVTPGLQAEVQSELDSVGGSGESASVKTKPERNRAASAEGVDAAGGEPQMVGDRMVGSLSDVNQGTTAGGERAGRGQSPRSSKEAGNDRGAKGDRNVVLGVGGSPIQKSLGSAVRLFARMHRKTGLGVPRRPDSGPLVKQVSGAECLRGWCDSSYALSRVPEPVHREPRTGKPDAGEPPVRFGWGATEQSVLYPHEGEVQPP